MSFFNFSFDCCKSNTCSEYSEVMVDSKDKDKEVEKSDNHKILEKRTNPNMKSSRKNLYLTSSQESGNNMKQKLKQHEGTNHNSKDESNPNSANTNSQKISIQEINVKSDIKDNNNKNEDSNNINIEENKNSTLALNTNGPNNEGEKNNNNSNINNNNKNNYKNFNAKTINLDNLDSGERKKLLEENNIVSNNNNNIKNSDKNETDKENENNNDNASSHDSVLTLTNLNLTENDNNINTSNNNQNSNNNNENNNPLQILGLNQSSNTHPPPLPPIETSGSKLLLTGELFFGKEIFIETNGMKNGLRKKKDNLTFFGLRNNLDYNGVFYNDFIINYTPKPDENTDSVTGRVFQISYNKRTKEYSLYFIHNSLILYYRVNTFVYFDSEKEYYLLLGNIFLTVNIKKSSPNEKVIFILVDYDDEEPKRFSFKQSQSPIKIGREAGSDLVINRPMISKFHGVIEFSKNSNMFYYKDMRSSNGSTLLIKEDDAIRIKGEMYFKLDMVGFKIQELP